MRNLLRWVGWLLPAALLHAGLHLPPARARQVAVGAIVVGNLLPVASVLAGLLTLGDVFLVYWCENAVWWAIGMVRVSTAQARPGHPNLFIGLFFGVHYGLFTLGHGQGALYLSEESGGTVAGPWGWALTGLGVALGQVVALWVDWFGNHERDRVTPERAMVLPYARLVVLHGGVLAAGALLEHPGRDGTAGAAAWAVALLCLGKLVLDLVLHLVDRRRAGRAVAPPARAGRHARGVTEESLAE